MKTRNVDLSSGLVSFLSLTRNILIVALEYEPHVGRKRKHAIGKCPAIFSRNFTRHAYDRGYRSPSPGQEEGSRGTLYNIMGVRTACVH